MSNGFKEMFGNPERSTLTPTEEQAQALDLFEEGLSFAIEAGAGTGKTSTLQLLAESTPRRGQYVAFNKSIVTEAGRKFPNTVACNTAHSLAFRAVGRNYQSRLNSSRMRSSELAHRLKVKSIQFNVGGSPKNLSQNYLGSLVMRTIDRFCQTVSDVPLESHIPYIDGIDVMKDDGQRDWTNNKAVRDYLMPFVLKAWKDIQNPNGQLPFKHGHYLKMWQLGDPIIDADFILFDEVQDADPVMADVVLRQEERGTQVILVGDSQQEIYGWRGAVNAFELFGLEDTTFLTQSFRFGHAVARVANHILENLSAPLRLRGFEKIDSSIAPVIRPDAILARTNATAVRTVLRFQTEGYPVHLVGGGTEILNFAKAVDDLRVMGKTFHPDLACFDSYEEVCEYVREDPQGGDLQLMVDLVEEFGTDIIRKALGSVSPEKPGTITVSTAHRAKGREWDSVMLCDDFASRKYKNGDEIPPSPEEQRLLYVAVTRAKHVLDITMVPQLAGVFV